MALCCPNFPGRFCVRTLRSIPIFANKMSSWPPWVFYKKSLSKCVLKKSEFKFSPNFPTTRFLFKNLQPGLSKVPYLAPLTYNIFWASLVAFTPSTDRTLQVESNMTLLVVQTVCKLCKKSNLIEWMQKTLHTRAQSIGWISFE